MAARRRADAAAFRRPRTAEPGTGEPPFVVLDATQIDEPANSDEALAVFALYVTPGDRISLHSRMCRTHLGIDENCTCTPVELLIGAVA